MFSWRVTRVLFALGVMAVVEPIFLFIFGAWSSSLWFAILTGFALVALSTRGPWDSETSGRNRLVLGFRARKGIGQEHR